MKTQDNEPPRQDSPICLIHFSHPFVFIKSPEELDVSDSSSSGDELDNDEFDPNSLLPFERLLKGPSRDLLTQLLFPDLCSIDTKGDLETVLKMLRDAWQRSRPNSGSNISPQREQKVTTKRRLSAPETRIRRFTIRTTVEEESPSCSSSRSAPATLNMCTDSVTSQNEMVDNCYCHTYTQNEFKFSCKVNFEENITTTHQYNCNYLNHYNYYPKLIPRYSAIPRSLSMLANCSSPSTSTSSVSSDEECQSLADSLEDISPSMARLPYDDKPVRGAPPLVPHRTAPRIPIQKSETFFVPLTDSETNEMLMLPPSLREKLDKRRLELENKPKVINRSVVVAQKSPRPYGRSRRILGTKFQRFECIPEENEARKGKLNKLPLTRTYIPRERQVSHGNRGLQAIMRDHHEAKIGLQESVLAETRPGLHSVISKPEEEMLAITSPAGLQGVIQDPGTVIGAARGKQAMAEQDLVAVTTGWVNFYMLRGEETVTTTTASSDSTSTVGSVSGRRTWSRGRGITQVSVSGRTSTVRVQQQAVAPRPIVFASTTRSRRADSEPDLRDREMHPLPRLPHSGDGTPRVQAREKPAILPALSRRNVPLIRVKQASTMSTTDSDTISLPALPASSSDTPRSIKNRVQTPHTTTTSTDQSPRPNRRRYLRGSSSKAVALRTNSTSRQVVRSQRREQQQVKSAIVTAEKTTAPPGMWSVTVSGMCPQPEMEVRLVFPPNAEAQQAAVTSATSAAAITAHHAHEGALEASPDSTSHFALAFKHDQKPTPPSSPRGRGSSASNNKNASSPNTSPKRRGSLKALPSPPKLESGPVAIRGGASELDLQDDPIAPEVNDPHALEALMWPEMQAILEEQVISIKKQQTSKITSSATLVERLRGGEDLNQDLAVRGAAITTRRKKRGSS